MLVILQASVGFINATGLFTQNYYATPQNQYNYQIQNLSDYQKVTQSPSAMDYLTMLASWTVGAFFIGIQIVFAVIFIFPFLVITFHIPVILSAFMQVGIYYYYAAWYSQWKSGKGWKSYE